MEVIKFKTLFFLILLCVINCSPLIVKHNPNKAATAAIEFGHLAFIKHDYEISYNMLSLTTKNNVTKEQFIEVLQEMSPPASSPTVLTATEFEPVPGTKVMNIFLKGQNERENFYYRIELEGIENEYQVSAFFRSRNEYPSSKLKQPLFPRRSTN